MENIITFEDFAKVDLRVGEIKEVEEIADADKLWKLSVDLGEENLRTICAGIKKYYSKEDLLNKKIIVVSNLAPRKMRGVESQGMLLAASDSDKKTPQAYPEKFPKKIFTKGKVVLISPDTLKGTSEEIENGSKVN
jgi:methionine--tRNA ligase beta chain